MVDVSVVIPTLNEEETIGICIDKVKEVFNRYNIDGEIIVSDSSTDNTPNLAKSKGAKIIRPKNKGYGSAYIEGINKSKGRYIIIGDADDTYDFLEIPKLLDPLINKEADFVLGDRFSGGIQKEAMPALHRYIGNPFLTKTLNVFFNSNISDAHCGLRGFTREAWEELDLKTMGMEFASEMIIKSVQKDLTIKEIPVKLYKRNGSKPKINSFGDGWRHLRFMMLHAPNYLFMVPGIVILSIGIFLMGSLVTGPISLWGVNLDIHPMILGSLLTLFGFQILLYFIIVKEYGVYNGLIDDSKTTKFVKSHFTLERGLTLGGAISLIGFGINLWILLSWIGGDLGVIPLSSLRLAILALTIFIIGIEVVFTSFILSIFNIRNIYAM